ncbi:MAG TPA: DNA-3-methyladenine glycosylase [Thermomicrobiales bacterium]|nr:DNA-3-methyladenine glycosylase [Thermomicrobiales bacterium]
MADGLATLDGDHFRVRVTEAARDLIGRMIVVGRGAEQRSAIVVETEAYAGLDDPASHAAFRPGGRAAVMASEPGTIYVYAAYGMYPCLNIVADERGVSSAVLVRGVWVDGDERAVLGPGLTTRLLGITLDDHGSMIGEGRIRISSVRRDATISVLPRVGIRRGVELPWRFIDQRVERNCG